MRLHVRYLLFSRSFAEDRVSSSLDPPRDLPSLHPAKRKRKAGEARCEHDVGTEYRGSSRQGPFRNDTARVINNVCFNVNLRRGSNLISTEATRSNADGDWLGGIVRHGTWR